jgi:SAM-dependent methyltransferase
LDSHEFPEIIHDASGRERYDIESSFLIEHMRLNNHTKIFDSCLGTGATSIGLKLKGIDNITSNEIDKDFAQFATRQAKENNVPLDITRYDWRKLPNRFRAEHDAVLCLGNSFTYLLQEQGRKRAMDNFYMILKPGGLLCIDTRNYTELLRGNFLNRGKGPYRQMGSVIQIEPLFIYPDITLFRYYKDEKKIDLLFYPLKDGELERLMINAGFKDIKTFGDYEPEGEFNPKTTEFYTFIGTKP